MNETTNGKFQPTPGDGWIPGCFHDNWINFPRDQLRPYEGKYVAVSLDGTRIVASADEEEQLADYLVKSGIPFTMVVIDYVDPPIGGYHALPL